jgi:hypothetical protein
MNTELHLSGEKEICLFSLSQRHFHALHMPILYQKKGEKRKKKKSYWQPHALVDKDEDELDYVGKAVATASTPPVNAPVKVP